MTKIAIVTGGNKGIGYEICLKLGAAGLKVILAARNETLGLEAVNKLKAAGYEVEYRNLDIASATSIERFALEFAATYDKLDILINNAAVALFDDDPSPKKGQAFYMINPNVFGTVKLTEALLPLLRKAEAPGIVNVASELGHLNILPSEELKARFLNATTVAEVDTLMKEFVQYWEEGVHVEKGWGAPRYTVYGISKVGLIAYTRVLAKLEAERDPAKNFLINAVTPGYCDTDLTHHLGGRPAEHGARTPVFVALWGADQKEQPTGKFFADEAEIKWKV